MSENGYIIYNYQNFFIQLSVNGYLGNFCVMPVKNNVLVNRGVQTARQAIDFGFFKCMFRSTNTRYFMAVLLLFFEHLL